MQPITKLCSKRQRPFGVILLALINAVVSTSTLFSVLPAILSVTQASAEAAGQRDNYTFYLECQAVTGLIAAGGLWFLAEWARWLTIARAAITILVLLVMNASQTITGSTALQLLISGAVILYLVQQGVRKAFAD